MSLKYGYCSNSQVIRRKCLRITNGKSVLKYLCHDLMKSKQNNNSSEKS